jgi:hypothetical protein
MSGGPHDIENRAIEQKVITCLNNLGNLGNLSYTCLSQNHVKNIFLPSRRTEILPTRDITVRLEIPGAVYVVTYNTADKTHTVINPSGSFGLSPENLQQVLTCIKSTQAGGRKRRYKKKSNTRRVKRKYSHKRY